MCAHDDARWPVFGWLAATPMSDAGFGPFDVAGGHLVPLVSTAPKPHPLAVFIHDQLRGALLSSAFPCLGGIGAIRRDDYAFALYAELGSSEAIDACAVDLREFADRRPAKTHPVAVFVAAFATMVALDEAEFEAELWKHLRGLERVDGGRPLRAEEFVDSDDPGFVYAHREFFVVGLSPHSSRWARRFGWPTLVFNALSHSELLRRSGVHDRMREKILRRDRLLQGGDNPSLARPQLAQFSGRSVDEDWTCPHHDPRDDVPSLSSPTPASRGSGKR